jgi:hypothetical protein
MATRKNNKDYITLTPRPKFITTVSTINPPKCNGCSCVYSTIYLDSNLGMCDDCIGTLDIVKNIKEEYKYELDVVKDDLEQLQYTAKSLLVSEILALYKKQEQYNKLYDKIAHIIYATSSDEPEQDELMYVYNKLKHINLEDLADVPDNQNQV